MIKEVCMINNLSVTDMYMSMLSSLSNDEKLDLITKLSESMKKKKRTPKKTKELFNRFNEDWGGNKTPEDIADDLRNSRVFTREIEEW